MIDTVVPRPKEELDAFLSELTGLFSKESTSKEDIVQVMKKYLPNFVHEEKGKNLDQKM